MRRLDVIGEDRGLAGAAGRQARANLRSSSLTRTTNGADCTSFGVTASPEAATCPVDDACRTVSTFPGKTLPGKNLKVTSTGWPGAI